MMNKGSDKMNHKIICQLTGKECIHIIPDTGEYENCRLCDVYQRLYIAIDGELR